MAVIYFTTPAVERSGERYEKYFYLLSHHFTNDELVEAKELCPDEQAWKQNWPTILERMDMLIFLRNGEKCLGKGTWREVQAAQQAGKEVYMCWTTKDGGLMLTPFDQLIVKLNLRDVGNYARVTNGPGSVGTAP